MKYQRSMQALVELFATSVTFTNGENASAASAPGLTKIDINGISVDGANWENFYNKDIHRTNTTFIEGENEYVYFRVRYTGYSNANILYHGSRSFTNQTAVNYQTTYITSGNIVTGFERYYKIPLSAFTGGYSLKVLGFSVNASQQVWSNTVSFPVN